jgi:hypothetical protein
MSGITIPVILTAIAVIAALFAYQGIRRGGARFYTLERETMLRRASFTLIGSMLLFLAAIVLLIYNYQQVTAGEVAEPAPENGVMATPTVDDVLIDQPPTATPTPTIDPNIPTPTVTPVICRAVVDGTAGSGLTLRDAPGGAELQVLPDGSILTLLESEPVEANGFIWRNVRTVGRIEGWVVEDFLTIGDCR